MFNESASFIWPNFSESFELSRSVATSDGKATLTQFAVCDKNGLPATPFPQGQEAHFYYEFKVEQPLASPIGGVMLFDSLDRPVHGKNSIQHGVQSPEDVQPGTLLRFHQTISLDLCEGEYRVVVGLASTDWDTYCGYSSGVLTHGELHGRLTQHCRVRLGDDCKLVVILPETGKLLHHGLVNLPGSCSLAVLPDGQPRPQNSIEPSQNRSQATFESATVAPVNREYESNLKGEPDTSDSPGILTKCRLIYLSSYPRSGNQWFRNLIEHYFDRRVSSLYPEPGCGNLEMNLDGSFGSTFSEFQTIYPPVTTLRRLVHGCGPILDVQARDMLTRTDEYFFVKTHEPPFDQYLDKEGVIYIVRHPGAAIWSYFHYLQDYHSNTALELTLEEVILGNVTAGSWSDHVQAWLKLKKAMDGRFLLFRYEELRSKEHSFCKVVSLLTGLPWRGSIGFFPSFEQWHNTAPKLYRSGNNEEWRQFFSAHQLELLRKCHFHAAEKLGYLLA